MTLLDSALEFLKQTGDEENELHEVIPDATDRLELANIGFDYRYPGIEGVVGPGLAAWVDLVDHGTPECIQAGLRVMRPLARRPDPIAAPSLPQPEKHRPNVQEPNGPPRPGDSRCTCCGYRARNLWAIGLDWICDFCHHERRYW